MPPAEEEPPILESEVAYAIRRMKPGTAPGPDGFSADLLRAGDEFVIKLMGQHISPKQHSDDVSRSISKNGA
ncbi:hypothetical protein Q1695_008195 [Nippostrongylus brasiliensis]|nr:hypothetical protein Q1695_008195 [Nippostrongylus brasiliensis]